MIEEGSAVEAGDVVIRFDRTELEKALLDGEAEVHTAESKATKMRAEVEATLDNLARDADVAQLELDAAPKFQSKDQSVFSRNQIIESEIDEHLAARRLSHFEAARKTQEVLSKAEEDLLVLERRTARLKVRQAEETLRALEIKAPHSGIVVFRRDWRGNLPRIGDMVWRSQPLADIPVLEADAGGLAAGRGAEVVLEARPEVTFKARIRRVDNVPKPRMRGIPVQYFGVTLELERTDPAVMKPGLRVSARLLLEERPGAIAVPLQAVSDQGARKIVYLQRNGGFHPTEVVLGPTSFGRVVVEEGLEEGDVIALRDPTRAVAETLGAGPAAGAPATPTPRAERRR